MLLLGLRTVIYPAPDLEISRAWYRDLLGIEPYFDQPFYVGFNVAGYELALDPDGDPGREVGDGIRVATVLDPGRSILGVIENPHFQIQPTQHPDGPGR